MSRPSMRGLAQELRISTATVSLALSDDPRISRETKERVKALAAARGYHADPVMSEGFSRARRRDFHRETVAWLLDRAPQEQPWIEALFEAAEERGRVLGYHIEYFPVDFSDEAAVRRLARVWRARGIRGVLVGPFGQALADPALRWSGFSWVTIGQSLISPALHRVGRDYDRDIELALAWLHARGCGRPAFVDDPGLHHLMRLPLLRAALVYYHEREHAFSTAFHTVDFLRPDAFKQWLKRNRPDSLVMGMSFENGHPEFHRLITHLPQVALTPWRYDRLAAEKIIPNYTSIGYSSIGLLHRILSAGEKGIPLHEQTVVISSGWNGAADK